ncbi:hypothetical protein CBS147321_7654 [Aspergillus niger]|nr:hypothetical protein CBS12448_5002 [Aspergillus niger]KAI2937667.1 hypothetical protein CBS147321_7654 [Aspergillus niger]KAI2970257.1 hypothetical protein CBS147324_5603 [Aspergillus niger]KAI3039038.1 hypothetical protein CBS147352_10507 [Aspergillus niger]
MTKDRRTSAGSSQSMDCYHHYHCNCHVFCSQLITRHCPAPSGSITYPLIQNSDIPENKHQEYTIFHPPLQLRSRSPASFIRTRSSFYPTLPPTMTI